MSNYTNTSFSISTTSMPPHALVNTNTNYQLITNNDLDFLQTCILRSHVNFAWHGGTNTNILLDALLLPAKAYYL